MIIKALAPMSSQQPRVECAPGSSLLQRLVQNAFSAPMLPRVHPPCHPVKRPIDLRLLSHLRLFRYEAPHCLEFITLTEEHQGWPAVRGFLALRRENPNLACFQLNVLDLAHLETLRISYQVGIKVGLAPSTARILRAALAAGG